ncbi:MAG: hypothetical protein V4733_03275 [Verrucomicrobiota bacterium]
MKIPYLSAGCAAVLGAATLLSLASDEAKTEQNSPPAEAGPPVTAFVEQADPGMVAIRAAEDDIRRRIGMPVQLVAGVDPGMDAEIEEMRRTGWLVDVTVEEIEAVLQAAAATSEIEDDQAATELAHRASCRFFLNEESTAQEE